MSWRRSRSWVGASGGIPLLRKWTGSTNSTPVGKIQHEFGGGGCKLSSSTLDEWSSGHPFMSFQGPDGFQSLLLKGGIRPLSCCPPEGINWPLCFAGVILLAALVSTLTTSATRTLALTQSLKRVRACPPLPRRESRRQRLHPAPPACASGRASTGASSGAGARPGAGGAGAGGGGSAVVAGRPGFTALRLGDNLGGIHKGRP